METTQMGRMGEKEKDAAKRSGWPPLGCCEIRNGHAICELFTRVVNVSAPELEAMAVNPRNFKVFCSVVCLPLKF